ncbi:MAG: membrane integrity-associated transporter subunit PqiC [Burkholderiales bacterium]|nr:membrane integrity-associated transporter subunit PqiC [Burkholderiales bacterium]
MKRRGFGAAALAGGAAALAGCVSVGIGNEPTATVNYQLRDAGAAPQRRPQPLVPALLIQPLPGDAMADTLSLAYSPRPQAYAYYQFANWTERPLRQLPRLLQRRLEALGVAGAVGLLGEPLRADWLLAVSVDSLVHDVSVQPSRARVALTLELFDRRSRQRLARRSFEAVVQAAEADAASAVQAASVATGQVFDAVQPWVEAELQRATKAQPN